MQSRSDGAPIAFQDGVLRDKRWARTCRKASRVPSAFHLGRFFFAPYHSGTAADQSRINPGTSALVGFRGELSWLRIRPSPAK